MDHELSREKYSYGGLEVDVKGFDVEGDLVTHLWLVILCGHQFRVTSSAVDSINKSAF